MNKMFLEGATHRCNEPSKAKFGSNMQQAKTAEAKATEILGKGMGVIPGGRLFFYILQEVPDDVCFCSTEQSRFQAPLAVALSLP